MKYYLEVLRKYRDFSGRASRKEYWMFVLFNIIFSIICSILDTLLKSKIVGDQGILSLAYSLFVFIPSTAVVVRRIHDINYSGWYFFVFLVSTIVIVIPPWFISIPPYITTFLMFVLFACIMMLTKDSFPGKNKYGPNPKGILATSTSSVVGTV